MFNRVSKIGLVLCALVGMNTAQGLPLSGRIDFGGSGHFIGDGVDEHVGGDAIGVHWTATPTSGDGGGPFTSTSLFASGGFNSMVGSSSIMTLSDFRLDDPTPILEWIISDITVAGTAGNFFGKLVFEILSGGEIDISSGGSTDFQTGLGKVDLAGAGRFLFDCDSSDTMGGCDDLDASTDRYETVTGNWSLEGLSDGSVIGGINVPAPASIGLLGLGLLGLGAFRRRKST